MTSHPYRRHKWQFRLSLILVCVQLLTLPATSKAKSVGDVFEYLYHDLPEGETVDPIVEYTVEHTDELQMPSFVGKDDKTDRIVEFYSPRCPHCIHFKPNYIQFARHFGNLTRQTNSPYSGLDVKFYAISCVKYKKVCRKQKANAFPTLKVYSGQTGQTTILHGSQLHPLTVLKALGKGQIEDHWQQEKGDGEEKNSAQQQQVILAQKTDNSPSFLPRTSSEVFGDAYLTFYNAMRDNVFLEDGPLPPRRGQALKQWLHYLEKAMPPWRMNWVVAELLDDFKNNAAAERQWNSIVDTYPPQQKVWSAACRLHDSPYTCGLWTLFHIATVALVEYNLQIENPETNAMKIQATTNVAVFLREYVKNFFLCQECSTHFVQAFDDCEYNRCKRLTKTENTFEEWRELPLWLLDFHNGVNVRLLKERFQREGKTTPPTVEEEQSVLWPPVQECPRCWTHLAGAKSEYDPDMMYKYMRLTYWPEDGATLETKRQLKVDIAEYEQNPHQKSRRTVSKTTGSSASQSTTMPANAPYMIVTAVVFGVWMVVLWKKCHMDRLLHRNKMRTV